MNDENLDCHLCYERLEGEVDVYTGDCGEDYEVCLSCTQRILKSGLEMEYSHSIFKKGNMKEFKFREKYKEKILKKGNAKIEEIKRIEISCHRCKEQILDSFDVYRDEYGELEFICEQCESEYSRGSYYIDTITVIKEEEEEKDKNSIDYYGDTYEETKEKGAFESCNLGDIDLKNFNFNKKDWTVSLDKDNGSMKNGSELFEELLQKGVTEISDADSEKIKKIIVKKANGLIEEDNAKKDHMERLIQQAKERELKREEEKRRKAQEAKEAKEREKNEAIATLDDLVGMDEIKKDLIDMLSHKEAKEFLSANSNLKISKPMMHTLIKGNPGVGKTELAKRLSLFYYKAGLIEENKLTYVRADEIIGQYVGHTSKQTLDKVREARGGVFFLDEAYRLNNSSDEQKGDFGKEALEAIMGAMEYYDDVIFVFAGYPDKIEDLLDINHGLRSRMPNIFHIKDYTANELKRMAVNNLKEKNYKTEEIETLLEKKILENMEQGILKGNGRTLKSYTDKVIARHFERIIASEDKGNIDMELILIEDVEKAFNQSEGDENRLKESFKIAKEKIEKMIGLDEVKEQLFDIGDFQYIQSKRKKLGLSVQKKTHHMFFLGEPGTGKTTMARLVGELMRGSGVLSNGHFIEATKEKMTAGSSIPKAVKKLIDQAKGGVLFIDEAYSLANDGKGKEALDSLIAHMENERDDLIVIMAGYEDDMENLMELNEGLASRVPYHMNFASYTDAQLFKMIENLIHNEGYIVEEHTKEELEALITNAKEEEIVNGNGRWVRNLFEQIQMVQSKRLMRLELDDAELEESDYRKFEFEDILSVKEKIHLFSKKIEKDTDRKEKFVDEVLKRHLEKQA